MAKSIKKNYIYNLVYEIITLLVPIITTPYVSRILGANGIGLYSYTYSVAAYFTYFAALGTTVYGRRETACLQDNIEKRSILFWEIMVFRFITTTISLFSYFVLLKFTNSLSPIAIAQCIYIIAILFDITWFFQGMENFGTVVLRNTIVKIIGLVFIFVFVKQPDDLLKYVIGIAAFPLIGSLFLWINLKNNINFVKLKFLKPSKHIKGSFYLFIPTIASQVYLLLDKVMIGAFTIENLENGYYEQSQKIVRICLTILTTVGTVMSPRIAYIYSRKELTKLKEYMHKSFRFIWLTAIPMTLGLFCVSSNLVPWFLGKEFTTVIMLLNIFALLIIPEGICSIIGNQYLVATKRQKYFNISIIIGAIINFLMNSVLIPKYYSLGAAIASIISEFLICIIQIYIIVFKLKEISISDIFGETKKYWFSGIAMFIILFSIQKMLTASIINTFILIITGIIIYFSMLIIQKDILILDVILMLKNKYRMKGHKKQPL